MRRDLAPSIVHLMTGRDIASYSTGSVRSRLFFDEYRLPRYVLRDRFGNPLSA